MPQFDVTRVDDIRRMQRMLSPERYWLNLQRILPRALAPTLVAVQANAPHGRTGKLARGFDVRVSAVHQGLIHGLNVDILARVPYGHLVHAGHRIIARGRGRGTRGAVIGSKQVTVTRHALMLSGQEATRQELVTRAVRSTRRRELLQRRSIGPIGFVPANPFVARTLQQQQPQTLAAVEIALQAAMERPV